MTCRISLILGSELILGSGLMLARIRAYPPSVSPGPSVSLCVPLSLCPSVPLSLCPSVPRSLGPSVPLSLCPSVPLSLCPSVPLCPIPPSLIPILYFHIAVPLTFRMLRRGALADRALVRARRRTTPVAAGHCADLIFRRRVPLR